MKNQKKSKKMTKVEKEKEEIKEEFSTKKYERGGVSARRITMLKSVFDLMDKNHNGLIDYKEFYNFINENIQTLEEGEDDSTLEAFKKLFEKLDEDKTGTIDFDVSYY